MINKLATYIWVELHRGNLIPLGSAIAIVWFFGMPLYYKYEASFDVATDASIKAYDLEAKVQELEHKLETQMRAREAGNVGITYH